MVRAFGFCNDDIDTTAPSRLCRGRERWIEGLPDAPSVRLARTVCSGAIFSDDSARDARRGLSFSGVSGGGLLSALFPSAPIYAFAEAGDPLAVPTGCLLEEDWMRPLNGGLREGPAVRWVVRVQPSEVEAYIAGERDGLVAPRADGFVVGGEAGPALYDAIYRLVGFSEPDDRPARKYCPAALPPLLELATAVVLLHLDKHAPVMAIYTREPLHADAVMDATARAAGAFPVPFAIPPMLARWDRALYELRMEWDAESAGEFPVPPAEDAGGRWSMRRRQYEEEEAARLPVGRTGTPEPEEPVEQEFDEDGGEEEVDEELDDDLDEEEGDEEEGDEEEDDEDEESDDDLDDAFGGPPGPDEP